MSASNPNESDLSQVDRRFAAYFSFTEDPATAFPPIPTNILSQWAARNGTIITEATHAASSSPIPLRDTLVATILDLPPAIKSQIMAASATNSVPPNPLEQRILARMQAAETKNDSKFEYLHSLIVKLQSETPATVPATAPTAPAPAPVPPVQEPMLPIQAALTALLALPTDRERFNFFANLSSDKISNGLCSELVERAYNNAKIGQSPSNLFPITPEAMRNIMTWTKLIPLTDFTPTSLIYTKPSFNQHLIKLTIQNFYVSSVFPGKGASNKAYINSLYSFHGDFSEADESALIDLDVALRQQMSTFGCVWSLDRSNPMVQKAVTHMDLASALAKRENNPRKRSRENHDTKPQICHNFNAGRCDVLKCSRRHECWKPGCHKDHAFYLSDCNTTKVSGYRTLLEFFKGSHA